jgi:N-acetylmuramoyl-L-alanine amidase
LCVAALNTRPEHASARVFLHILRDTLGADASASQMIGVPTKPVLMRKSFAATSRKAAGLVQRGAVGQTGAVDRGTVARGDLSGFNYATVPSVLVECGFLSNPVEDQLLSSPNYQDKVAEGITQGVISYLEGKK